MLTEGVDSKDTGGEKDRAEKPKRRVFPLQVSYALGVEARADDDDNNSDDDDNNSRYLYPIK